MNSFDPKEYPWSVVEYSDDISGPLVEAVPTTWLYEGKTIRDSNGEKIVTAKSYWPKQAAKVATFIDQMRSPGGICGIVDSTLWEKDHSVVILDFCKTQKEAQRHRDKAVYTDHLDTSDSEKTQHKRRRPGKPQRYDSDDESQPPPPVKLSINRSTSSKLPPRQCKDNSKLGPKAAKAQTSKATDKSSPWKPTHVKKTYKRIVVSSEDEDSGGETATSVVTEKGRKKHKKGDTVDEESTILPSQSLIAQKAALLQKRTREKKKPETTNSTNSEGGADADSVPPQSLIAQKAALLEKRSGKRSQERGDLDRSREANGYSSPTNVLDKGPDADTARSQPLVAQKAALLEKGSGKESQEGGGLDGSDESNGDSSSTNFEDGPDFTEGASFREDKDANGSDEAQGKDPNDGLDWTSLELETSRNFGEKNNGSPTLESVRKNLSFSCPGLGDGAPRNYVSLSQPLHTAGTPVRHLSDGKPHSPSGTIRKQSRVMSSNLASKLKSLRPSSNVSHYLAARRVIVSPAKTATRFSTTDKELPRASARPSAAALASSGDLPATKRDVADLKSSVCKMEILLHKMWLIVGSSMGGDEEPPSLPKRPFETLEEMDKWQEFIEADHTNFLIVVNFLVSHMSNTSSLKDLTVDTLKFLFTDEVAAEFNVDGRIKRNCEPKLPLGNTPTFKNMKVALMKYITKLNKGKNPQDITMVYDYSIVKEATGNYLKDAPKRYQNQVAAAERLKNKLEGRDANLHED